MPLGAAALKGLQAAFGKASGGIKGGLQGLKEGARPLDSAQSMLSGFRVKDILKNPAFAPAAWFAFGPGQFGQHAIVDPIRDAIKFDPYRESLEQSKQNHEMKQHALMRRAEIEDMERKVMRASMRLAALDPHLYNEVMAGRSLPKDAVVFGGQPRQDLMEELSMAMAQGQFKNTSAQDELMQELGV